MGTTYFDTLHKHRVSTQEIVHASSGSSSICPLFYRWRKIGNTWPWWWIDFSCGSLPWRSSWDPRASSFRLPPSMTPGPPSTWSCRRSRPPLLSLYPRLWQEARWVTTYKSDPIWSVLIRSDPLWSDLIRIDPIRWNMRRTHGSLYPRLWQEARWVAYRSDLIQSDPKWSVLIQSDLIRIDPIRYENMRRTTFWWLSTTYIM